MTLRLGCLISGGGRTVLNLQDAIERGELPASIEIVIAHREDVAGVGDDAAGVTAKGGGVGEVFLFGRGLSTHAL